jgi:hypothetical protein
MNHFARQSLHPRQVPQHARQALNAPPRVA